MHTHAFNCDSNVDDFMQTWTGQKKRYCCYLRGIGCHTKVIYRPHYHTVTKSRVCRCQCMCPSLRHHPKSSTRW